MLRIPSDTAEADEEHDEAVDVGDGDVGDDEEEVEVENLQILEIKDEQRIVMDVIMSKTVDDKSSGVSKKKKKPKKKQKQALAAAAAAAVAAIVDVQVGKSRAKIRANSWHKPIPEAAPVPAHQLRMLARINWQSVVAKMLGIVKLKQLLSLPINVMTACHQIPNVLVMSKILVMAVKPIRCHRPMYLVLRRRSVRRFCARMAFVIMHMAAARRSWKRNTVNITIMNRIHVICTIVQAVACSAYGKCW